MRLTTVDWAVIVGFFAVNLVIGFAFGRRAGKSTNEFFLSGRNVPWWLAGTSMVATTFGADTPLAVSGMVVRHGVAGNWLWWNAVASGMLTVFFFAALWRRAGVMTDVELVEMRYAAPRRGLRAFRAAYLALPINCIILGWVNLAMAKILDLTLGLPKATSIAVCLALTGVYTERVGPLGRAGHRRAAVRGEARDDHRARGLGRARGGGIDHIRAVLPAERLEVLPPVDAPWMPAIALAVYLGVQWWAAWYPGAEPGGGGYVAQRIFSAKSERDGVLATLWFNVAHYCVRTWPWVLTALAALVLYPELREGRGDGEAAYVRVMIDHLPPALRGLMMAGFLAAYMSTAATHLNWGASYLVRDLYGRFIAPEADERQLVRASRSPPCSPWSSRAGSPCSSGPSRARGRSSSRSGSGGGFVLILRWYWWRINAWSEVSAMVASLVASVVLQKVVGLDADDPRGFAYLMLGTLAFTTVTWLAVTFATKPELGSLILRRYAQGSLLLVAAVLAALVIARDLRTHKL
jgi:SSS family solute:Na+ symporter